MTDMLGFEDDFIDDIGKISIKKVVEKKPRFKDEAIIIFEEKAIRDTVKAQGHRLANHQEEAGMRLQIPNHLQKSFRSLMNLSCELKKKHPDLKRSVKFDEEAMDMFMDIQTSGGGSWQRVEPQQAVKFNAGKRTAGASLIGSEELEGLLEGSKT